MASAAGGFVTEVFEDAGAREVTVYIPAGDPRRVVFAADGGWHVSRLAASLEGADVPDTMIVGVHGMQDDDGRLKEYVPGFDPEAFAAHERLFVDQARAWLASRFEVSLPASRTAVWGASLGGEFSLAMGHRHPDVFGAVFCASPGGGYKPGEVLPASPPRTYLVAGKQEPWFLENAARWAEALRAADVEVVLEEREGEHGGEFWMREFPLMVLWAFGK